MTTEQGVTAPPATYRRLLRVPGFRQLLISSMLTRTAAQMWTVGLVIFALQRYHSPSVAGVSLFLLIFPGLLLSPIAGALLDRHGRKRLMTLDFIVAAVCLTVIVLLAASNRLPIWGLYTLLVCGSLTSTLSIAGARSFFPIIVPRDLWDRGNAADSVLYGVANIAGPALAGALIAAIGSEAALAGAAVGYVAGAVALQAVGEPPRTHEVHGRILHEAWRGLCYVVTNRTLRWVAITFSTMNVGWGIVIVALPVVVFHLHGNAAVVGLILALAGAAGVPAALVAGRIRTEGRERESMALFGAVMGVAVLALLVPSIARHRCRHRDRRRRGLSVERQRVLAAPAPHGAGVVWTRIRGVDGAELLRRAGRVSSCWTGTECLDHLRHPRRRRTHAHRERPDATQDPCCRITCLSPSHADSSRTRSPLLG